MIIRATQKKMISPPVTRTLVGWNVSRSFVFSGQPIGEKVQSHDENHVSRTSSSCASFVLRTSGSGPVRRATIVSRRPQYHTGIRCPHQSCREMHQSLMFSIQEVDVPQRSGVELDLAPLHRLDARLGERLHPEEPLPRDVRLDRRAAAVVVADRMLVVVDLPEQPLLLERGEHARPRFAPVEPGEAGPPPRSSSPRGR